MRCLFVAILIALPLHAESPTADEFNAELSKLDANSSQQVRLAVTKWIAAKAESDHAVLAIAPLENLIRSDDEESLRQTAIAARYRIARHRNEPCPLVFFSALRDKAEFVRYEASMWVGLHKGRYAEGSVKLLIEALSDTRSEVRSDCLYLLGIVGGKDASALQAVEIAKKDKVFDVRHAAFVSQFKLTNNLGEHLDYLVRLSEDPAPLLDTFPIGSVEAQKQQVQRNLYVLGSVLIVAGWSEDRPEELAKGLVKMLDHKSPKIRGGAARLLGAASHRIELTQSKLPGLYDPPYSYLDSGEFEKFQPLNLLLPGAKKEKPRPPIPSNAYAKFREYKAPRLLAYLSTMDEDTTVRAAAKTALQRFADLPEPVTIRPREVKP